MSDKTSVDPGALRAAARIQDGIADDIKKPDDTALKDTGAAADTMHGWSVASALREIADSWGPALEGLHERLTTGAANLRRTADTHEWNDQWVQQDFEDFDGDMSDVIMSAPASGSATGVGTLSAPAPGPGSTGLAAFTPLAPPSDGSLPDAGEPARSPMPTVPAANDDGAAGTSLTPPSDRSLPDPGGTARSPMPTLDPDLPTAPHRGGDDLPFG